MASAIYRSDSLVPKYHIIEGPPCIRNRCVLANTYDILTCIVSALSFGMSMSFSLRFSTLLARSSIDCFLGLGVVVLLERVLPMLDLKVIN